MDNSVITNLKLVYKPLIMYYGEWELLPGLEKISLMGKKKSKYEEFLDRYYYMPLNVIFKDEELVRSFQYSICSKLGEGGRTLFFSKIAFLRNVIGNAEDVVNSGNEEIFQSIKKCIRERKDVYREVLKDGENSKYYKEVKNEYLSCNLDISLEEYITLCKKKYTKLLTGYNAVLDLFNKSVNITKFIECFNPDQLYLFTMYSVLKHSEESFEKYGKLDYNVVTLDTYRECVEAIRAKNSFYNSYILVNDNIIYTIDDLFVEYDKLIDRSSKNR